jgi:hypothetical protein
VAAVPTEPAVPTVAAVGSIVAGVVGAFAAEV